MVEITPDHFSLPTGLKHITWKPAPLRQFNKSNLQCTSWNQQPTAELLYGKGTWLKIPTRMTRYDKHIKTAGQSVAKKKSRSEKVFSNHRSAPWRQQDFQAEDPKEDPPRSESPSGSQWRMDLRRPLILVPVNYFYRGHPEKMDHNHMEKSKCW